MAENVRRDSAFAGVRGHGPGPLVGVDPRGRRRGVTSLDAVAGRRGLLGHRLSPAAQTDVDLRPGP